MVYFLGFIGICVILFLVADSKSKEGNKDVQPAATSEIERAYSKPREAVEPSQPIARPIVKNEATKLREKGDKRAAYKASMFLPPIQKGYQIFLQNMGITGLGNRREEAIAFIDDLNQTVRLEREPNNAQDANAIKVIGVGKSGEYFLGYLPKDAALQIVKTATFDAVYGRLVRAYRGTDDYLEIQLQIIGLKDQKKIFDAFAKQLPANDSQKEYLTYWGIRFNSELTVEEADNRIAEHSRKARLEPAAWKEYTTFLNLLEGLEDENQREYYGIKEVPREIAIATINAMKDELGSYEEVAEEPEAIAERILETHPKFALI